MNSISVMHLQEYALYALSVAWDLWNNPYLFMRFISKKITVTIMFSTILSAFLPVLPVVPFPKCHYLSAIALSATQFMVCICCMYTWESVLTKSQSSVFIFVNFSWNCWGSYWIFISLIFFWNNSIIWSFYYFNK